MSRNLISVIGDEDTVTGFLLAGIGEDNVATKPNFHVVEESDSNADLEKVCNSFIKRPDIAIIIITQTIANRVRHIIDDYDQLLPVILEVPSKNSPYDPSQDSVLLRIKQIFGAGLGSEESEESVT